MRFSHRVLSLASLASLAVLAGCNAQITITPTDDAGPVADAGPDAPADTGPDAATDDTDADAAPADAGPDVIPPGQHVSVDKVDLLLMIDNSPSMADKQDVLKNAVPDLVTHLLNPNCLDATGGIIAPSVNGACATGTLEFPAVKDMHVGIVSSSLGGRGSDACDPSFKNPTNNALSAHNDDGAHLITRGGTDEHPVLDASTSGFLSFAAGDNAATLEADFADLIVGSGAYGCGFEAQLESWYRFLVQPDPYLSIDRPQSTAKATLNGVDTTILKQRHDFLRPDSLVAVVLLTDENDSTVDPLAIGGQGWAYENSTFPGSKTGGGAARGTSACATNPADPSCTSCGFGQTPSDPACQINGGYFDPATEDPLNERFFHMKQRFGVDPQFPISRYLTGLTDIKVPNRDGEHPNSSANYVGQPNCTNPLYAAALPDGSNTSAAALCNLVPGARSPDQVLFAVIGGVPQQLLHFDPTKPESGKLSADDWTKILGKDPLNYDFTGADPHMLESITPRAGLPGTTAANDADPINGREYDTKGSDLQYACTFPLPQARDCTNPANTYACDCSNGSTSPVCDATTKTNQVRGKAYPAIRELSVARTLGDRGIATSICPTTLEATSPMAGYRPAVKAIVDRIGPVLKNGVTTR